MERGSGEKRKGLEAIFSVVEYLISTELKISREINGDSELIVWFVCLISKQVT